MKTLLDSIKVLWRMGMFFSPKNTAILVVDAQAEYCSAAEGGNSHTEARAVTIQSLMPAFRKAGIPVYAVHYDGLEKKREDIRFHIFTPEQSDEVSRKNHTSAFHQTPLHEKLKLRGIKNVLLCGFWADACVAATATDAKSNGFNVCVLRDMTAGLAERHEQAAENRLSAQGIFYANSNEVLSAARLTGKLR